MTVATMARTVAVIESFILNALAVVEESGG
jgi:hypothetical protein